MSKFEQLKEQLKLKAGRANAVYKLLLAMGIITGLTSNVSATVDFSAITDLINATMGVLSIMVANTSTLVGFAVLMGILGLISVIIYLFVGKIFINAGNMMNGLGGHGKK